MGESYGVRIFQEQETQRRNKETKMAAKSLINLNIVAN